MNGILNAGHMCPNHRCREVKERTMGKSKSEKNALEVSNDEIPTWVKDESSGRATPYT